MPAIVLDARGITMDLAVQVRAGRTAVTTPVADRIRIRIAAAPVDDRANAELVRFLAAEFGVRREHVRLLKGASSRSKSVRIVAPRRIPDWARAASGPPLGSHAPPA
jgi:uncharacterized protein (TIGR00251 family)